MPRFSETKYDPRNDSSVGAELYHCDVDLLDNDPEADNPGYDPRNTVILVIDKGKCLCGCGEPPVGRDSFFRMGHDARLRGKLIRAYIMGHEVARVGDTGNTSSDAMSWAKQLEWGSYLETAKAREDALRAARIERSNRKLVEEATGPQVGDRKLLKIGRWEYTGEVIAVYDDGDRIVYRYTTKSGDVREYEEAKA